MGSQFIRPILKTCSLIIMIMTTGLNHGIIYRGIICPRQIGIETLVDYQAATRTPIMKNGHEHMGSSVKKQLEKRYQKENTQMRKESNAANLIDHSFQYKHTNMLTIISRVTQTDLAWEMNLVMPILKKLISNSNLYFIY